MIVVARAGSPLVIGIGVGENFIASDVFALLPVTQQFIFLEEGDLAEIRRDGVRASSTPTVNRSSARCAPASCRHRMPKNTGTTCSKRSSSSRR